MTTKDTSLVVYHTSVGRTPVLYVGELVMHASKEHVLTLKKVLMAVAGENSQQLNVGPLPYASRDSSITLDTIATPGLLIDNPDSQILNMYQDNITQAYSSLTLV